MEEADRRNAAAMALQSRLANVRLNIRAADTGVIQSSEFLKDNQELAVTYRRHEQEILEAMRTLGVDEEPKNA